MKRLISLMAIIGLLTLAPMSMAQTASSKDSVAQVTTLADDSATAISYIDSLAADSSTIALDDMELSEDLDGEAGGVHHRLKKMFIDGTPLFMSLVALALVLGLAFCIVAVPQISVKGKINEKMDDIERSIYSYGSVQTAKLEKGTSWIKLFIAMAPSLGFLGTVIGMVMAFEQIQLAGDIGPTIVASGMKVALITTIFGIVVALILQLFYSYITSKIEHLTSQMEESVVTLLDTIMKYKHEHND